MIYYPVESYNNRQRAEQRWDDNARTNLNDDGWQISIKNGKRLRRHWTRNGGLAIISTSYGEQSIYNEQYDMDLKEAKYNTALQPDGGWGFFTEFQ